MADRNSIRLRGTIVGAQLFMHQTSLRIAVEGRRNRDGVVSSEYPDIVFVDPAQVRDYYPGMRVTIAGHMGTRRIQTAEGRIRFVPVFYGEQIKKTKRILGEVYDGLPEEGGFEGDYNLSLFEGEIARIHIPEGQVPSIQEQVRSQKRRPVTACYLTLLLRDGNRQRLIGIACYNRQAAAASVCKVGDRVAIAGMIRAQRDATGFNRQSMVCVDFAKLEDAKPETAEQTPAEAPVQEATDDDVRLDASETADRQASEESLLDAAGGKPEDEE